MLARLVCCLLGGALLLGGCPGSDGTKDSGGSPQVDLSPDTVPAVDSSPDTIPPLDAVPPDSGPPRICGPAPVAFSGTLCGPASAPCKVKVDEVLPSTKSGGLFPSIALDGNGGLHMLARNVTGWDGFYNYRPKNGTWTVTKVSFDPAPGGLTVTPSGEILAVSRRAQQKGLFLFKLDYRGWQQHQVIRIGWVGSSTPNIGDLLSDSVGCLHARRHENGSLFYMQRGISGTWTEQVIPSPTFIDSLEMILSPAGAPYLAFAHNLNLFMWAFGETKGTQVNPSNTSTRTAYEKAFVVTKGAGAEEPHFLRVHSFSKPTKKEILKLVYSHRKGGSWTHKVVGTDGVHSCRACTVGAKCSVNFFLYTPLFMVASGSGDVRLFYIQTRRHGHMVGTPHYKTGACIWVGGSSSYQLRVGWFAGGKIQSAGIKVLASVPEDPRGILDKSGNIHLGYTSTVGPHQHNVRYMKVGK